MFRSCLPQGRLPSADQTDLKDYFDKLARHSRLTPEEEIQHATEIIHSRERYWTELLSYPPFTEPLSVLLHNEVLQLGKYKRKLSDEEMASQRSGTNAAFREASLATAAAARALRDRDRKRTRTEFEDATRQFAVFLAARDFECLIAHPIADLLPLLQDGKGVDQLPVTPPRKGSQPYRDYLARVSTARQTLLTQRNAFVNANLRLVVSVARSYTNTPMALNDRIGEGNLGLFLAVDRYDPARGCRFSTMAIYWIRHAIQRAFVNTGRTIRLPAHIHTLAPKVTAVRRSLIRDGLEPTDAAIAMRLQTSVQAVRTARKVYETILSAEAPLYADDDATPIKDLITDDAPSQEAVLVEQQKRERVRHVIATMQMTPLERTIIESRFGLNGNEPRTLAQIGSAARLSRERIRQIQECILGRIRIQLEDHSLPDTLPRTSPLHAPKLG